MATTLFGGCQNSGVGDPCVPEEEYLERFAGFKLTEENIESRSFQCQTRICLVNHLQGRVSCPLGQPAPIVCDPANNGSECQADPGTSCIEAGQIINDCDPTPCDSLGANPKNCNQADGSNKLCGGAHCNVDAHYCECDPAVDPATQPEKCAAGNCCPDKHLCDPNSRLCTANICGKPRADLAENEQRCYLPGSDVPVAVPVCSQCAASSKRTTDDAVYCSCRCDTADGAPDEPNFNFCDCPEGFSCEQVRPYIEEIGDQQLSGKYCVKQGTVYQDKSSCGLVQGWWSVGCDGTDGSI